MAEKQTGSDRVGEEIEDLDALQADPTLDIVRQLIVESEAIPAPARRPAGPATPRPGANTDADAGAPPVAAAGAAAGSAMDPQPVAEPVRAPVRAPVPDALSEAWDDDAEDDDWDDFALGAATRSYGIVDPDTGERVVLDGAEADAGHPADDTTMRRVGPGPVSRWLGGAMRFAGRLSGAAVRAAGALLGAGLAAVARTVARFVRRPDAPRRLAVALLVIFVIAWPWKVLSLTLLIPLAAVIAWASVGNDGCVELVVRWHDRLKARDPDKAERIRQRAAATTRGLNHVIERLPARWTQGLYLPDFETDGYVPEKLKVDPFEELAARVHSTKHANGQ